MQVYFGADLHIEYSNMYLHLLSMSMCKGAGGACVHIMQYSSKVNVFLRKVLLLVGGVGVGGGGGGGRGREWFAMESLSVCWHVWLWTSVADSCTEGS